MTSTNDGKDVKSNHISGPKSKTYFIELYKSLDARLSGECSGEERTRLVCQSWRRVHSLCQHSAPDTQLHLINWLQQHTANTILQTEWQSPKSKEQHAWLKQAIDEFIQECQNAISKREGGWSPPWEHQLQLRALWFRSTLPNPWGHKVLEALLASKGTQPSDEAVLEWLKLERGVMFVTRLRQLAASKCDDLALLLATAVMDKIRAATVIVSDVEQAEAKEKLQLLNDGESSTFVKILREEAGFTEEVWTLITDIEFVLSYKGELRSRCIELAKRTPLRDGSRLAGRLHGRLERSPRDRKLWKNAREAATLVAEVVVARCMVVPRCVGAARGALSECAGLLALLLAPPRLRAAAAALAAPAATSRHLYTLAEAVHERYKDEKTPFVCELYVRAITAGVNELERLKIKTEKESEARATEKTLSSWFSKLGGLLSTSKRLYCECILTAFSIHPSPAMYERVKAAPALAPLKTDIQETNEEANSEYGSWATDSRTRTNFVKTSETLKLKKTQGRANVLSTAIFAEGEALGLGADLCQDLAVLISGPRVKTLSWDTDRCQLLSGCAAQCERTRGGTRAPRTELRYLNLDHTRYGHLPEDLDDDGDLYYGIEKGYEHLVDFQEPEEIWRDAVSDDVGESDGAASPPAVPRRKINKTKRLKYSSDEETESPVSETVTKSKETKEGPRGKEREGERIEKKHKTKVKRETNDESVEVVEASEKRTKKKERKERKKKDTSPKPIARPSGSLSRLVGMKVAGLSVLNSNLDRRSDGNVCVTDSDYDSQGKSSIASLYSEGNDPDVLFDGLFSMEDIKSPEKSVHDNIQRANMSKMDELSLSSGAAVKYQRNLQSSSHQTPLQSSNVNHVRENVKNSIKKLIEFRRFKNNNDELLIKTDVNTQRPMYEQQSLQNNIPVLNTQSVSNIPKVFVHKEQLKQLNALKHEVNNILQKTSFGRDKTSCNDAPEKLMSPNTITKRPKERAKKTSYKSNASIKVEQQLKLNDSMSIINQQGSLETTERTAESNQNKHQEIIKHLEKSSSKINLKTMHSSRPGKFLEKSETAIQNIYQSIPQHISNTSSSLLHTKVIKTDEIIQGSHNLHQCPSKISQLQHRPVNQKHDPRQQQIHSFLKDLQVSINAGASSDNHESKVSPTQTGSKKTLQQKKSDKVPHTFARMNYLKNKQTDLKLKSMDKTLQSKCIYGPSIESLQHLHSNGEILISKIDKRKAPVYKEKDKIKIENQDNKPKVTIEMIDVNNPYKPSTTPLNIVKKHPTVSNILLNGTQKHVPNTSSANDLNCIATMPVALAPERTSFLSEKDQDDMLHLLRQQSLLNSIKVRHKTDIPKSSVDSVTISNTTTPLIVNPDRRQSSSASNINNTTPEPKNTNEKQLATAVLKVSNTKPASASNSKKRNAKETDKSTKDVLKNSDWESVMNALLATKTPTRMSQSGPNALDIALNKDSFERCYSSKPISQNQKKIIPSVITEINKSKPAIYIQKPVSDTIEISATKSASVKKCEIKSKDRELSGSSKPQTITRPLPVSKPVLKSKPIFIEKHLDSSKKHTIHRPGKPLPSVIQNRNDPFISGIKKSDYDLLDELMDEDLRQEIGELSDEEPYNVPLPNTTKYKNILNPSNMLNKNNSALNKRLYVHQQHNSELFENTSNLTDSIYKASVRYQDVLKPRVQEKKCTLSTNTSDKKLRIISNEVIAPGNLVNNNINYFPVISNTAAAVKDSDELKHNFNITPKTSSVCVSNHITPTISNPDSTVTIDAQTTNNNINKMQNSRFNILDPATVVLTVPPRNTQTNVMLIGNEFIYDPFSNTQLDQANLTGSASNYNHNTSVNPVPKVTVYHTTQFATPVVNPVLIENPTVLPIAKSTNNVTPEVSQITSSSIVHGGIRGNTICTNKLKSDIKNEIPVIEQLISQPTNIKLIDKDNVNHSVPECDILKVSKATSPEISRKPQKHNTYIADKNKISVSRIPILPITVSSNNDDTINSSHLDSQMKTETSLLFPQQIVQDRPSQKSKTDKTGKEDIVAPIQCPVKDIIEETDLKKIRIEDVHKQSKTTNHHYCRLAQKRLRILKREVEHRSHDKPIALSYEPIKPNQLTEVNNQKIENLLNMPSIVPKEIELPKPTCRHILLRSSNSLKVMKTHGTETLTSKGKSKLIGVKISKAKVKHKSKPLSKLCKTDFSKSITAAKMTETCHMKQEYLNTTQKPISEEIAKSIEDIKETEKLDIINNKNETKIDSHTDSLEDSMEFSVIPASQIKDTEIPLKKEFPESKTQDRQLDSFTECNSKDSSKSPAVTLKNIEDSTELATNTLQSEFKVTKTISMKDQISTNNNNVSKVISDKSTDDKNMKIRDEFKDKIIFENLPNLDNDQSKRYIRIKVPNGSFKATISGELNVNIDSILEDPSIKSMLWEKMNCNTKCILNIKQIAVQSKNCPSIIKTHIQDVSYVIKDDLETINLISDDDEELTQKFETEFGSFNIAKMDSIIFTKHQRKFFQRCEVRIVRSKLKKNKVFDLLEENTSNSIISVENLCGILQDTPIKIEDYIEIDDSSNESVNVMSTTDSTIVKDSEVETKLNGNVSNLNNHILHDFVSDNIDRNVKENKVELLNSKMSETCESSENILEFDIKDCSLKIEKCDQLIKEYEQMKIKNNKCFVNLVRCDSSQFCRKKAEDNFNLLEESSQFSDVLNVDEEISEMCEQSLKRVDSFSILNDLSTSDQDVSRVSPSVIAEYYAFTNLRENTNTFSDINLVIDSLPLNCFGDWFMTKSKIRGIGLEPNECKFITFGISKTYVTSDDLSTDCDSDRESNPASDENYYEKCSSEKERNVYQAPSLLKIMVDFLDNNIHIIETLKPTRTSSKFQHVPRTPSLKRKLNDFKENKNRTKISKLENQSTLLESDYKIIELVTKQANKTGTSQENEPESLKNICRLYIANIYNRYEVNSAVFTRECDKQMERKEAHNESSLLICDDKKDNTTPEALESFKPSKSVIEEAIEKKQAKYNKNKFSYDKINMKGLDCHVEQDEKLKCMEDDIDLDITKSIANEASVFECKNGSMKNNKTVDACVELQTVSNCIENVVENLNYANKISNTLENCSEKEDESMKSFCRDKIVISKELTIVSHETTLKVNSDNEKSTLETKISNLSSSSKEDNVEINKNKDTIPHDGVLNKNKSDESIVDVPLQDFNSDHTSEILMNSYTNNIKLKIDKNYDTQNVNVEFLSTQKERCNSLLTTPTEYSLDEKIYEISTRNKVDNDKVEDNVDNHLSIGVQFHSPLVPQNDQLLSNKDSNKSVILTVDMEEKTDHSDPIILPDELIKNFISDHSKTEINMNYPCSSENSNILCDIDKNEIIDKTLDLETERIERDEVELSGFFEKSEIESIKDPLSECDDTLDNNSRVIILSDDVKQKNNIPDDKLKENKISNSLCSTSKILDLSYKEDYKDNDSPNLIIKQFKDDETEKVIAFEEIKSPMDYENIFDKSCDPSYDTQVQIKIPCLGENRYKEKDNIRVTSSEETLKSVEVKPVPLLENPEIIMDRVENIKISETSKNEQYDINISENLKMINSSSDIDLEKNITTNDVLGKQLNSGYADISKKIKLHNEQTNNKYLCNEYLPSLTYENNNTVNKKEALLELAGLGVETNSIISKNNVLKNEESYLSEINKIDLNQQHISDVLNENDEHNKAIKYENDISSDKSKQKNVTLVYKGDSRVVLEGSIYEDPVVGTCYVFPILNKALFPEDILSNVSNDKSISVLQQLKNKVIEDKFNDDKKINDEVTFNALPKITYLRGRLKDDDMNDPNVKKNKRNLKRKIDFNDKQSGKKYRKGKNIDHPKLTATAINDLCYGREYKRFFDYCNSITFSYSRPFHIEHIDVSDLLKSWPIKGITVDNTDQTDFKNVLFIDEDIYQVPYDPLQQTFSEEISNCNEQQYTCSNIIENNFSMGFGEGSDRVIHISKDDEDNISKFSAATLSDVKQSQPFLMSNHHETNMRRAQEPKPYKEQKEVFKRYLTYVQLKEKVRSFFQNNTLELNKTWLTDNKIKYNKNNFQNRFPYELTCPDYIRPVPFQCVVQVVQVGQLPVSAAQNPVTCDPRVTQVTDASPSQCSGENSPNDSQSPIKTEYTELTTADISLPLVQEYERHIEAQESSKALVSLDNIPVETEIKTEIKDEISDFENDQNDCNENNVLQTLVNKHINNIEYSYESTDCSESLHTHADSETIYEQEIYNNCDFIPEQKQHNSLEKTDQIAHAMNAAGITTSSEAMSKSRMSVNVMSQNICQEVANNNPPSSNDISKTTINSMTLQQALAQILPPPLNPTSQETNQSSTNSPLTSQVLHIVQGKNSNGNQLTLVDNSQNSVISNSNTPMLHIVQNKGSHSNSTSNTNAGQHTNSFGGLSLVESGLQQGNNQLLHIVNAGSQKNSTTGQLLKRVNLLTNLTNPQGSNEQKMVQFVCKSADGKSIQLNAPHQRSMVLRLQPIESNIQNNPKPTDSQELSPISNGNTSSPIKEAANTQHEIKSRSVYEENYAKFIQSSNKSVPEKSTTLPKFNQAFGKQVFQDNNQKANDLNSNNSHLSINSSTENSEGQGTDNSINIDHIGQISSPPLLLRKSPAQTSQAQSNLVQQIKQTIAPMNIQTMHGGVIYTRQIPVNIGGGQTINLITVPSTELLDNDNQKPQGEVKFINQNDTESPIIKIVPHGPNNSNLEGSTEDSNNHIGITNENGQSTPTQHQPVLTQMRIKLPMLSKTPQMVSGTRVVRPSFFQIQRNVIGGANQPVYQQLVLTAAPPLSQHIRLPQTQTTRQVKVSADGQSSSESQMSTSTLEQLREFDMVLEQVKERSTVQPNTVANNAFAKLHCSASDTTDGSSVTSTVTESTQQVLYSIGNNQSLNVAYVNRKPNPTFVRSPDSSGIIDSPSSSTQIPQTVTSESTSNDVSSQPSQPKAAKVGAKSKSRPKSSSNSSNTMKINAVPPKTSTQKPLEDEQTTQRILYILAEYKEQVENSPDKDKPAPRRRSNPPSNPGSSKRKKSSSGSRRSGMRDMSPVHGEDTCRTMGSEDSSCGTSQGDCNDSCMDSHSPQDSPRKVVRKLTFDSEAITPSQPKPQPQRNVIVADGQTITVARGTSGKPTTAVLMPANYILPVSMVKGGQQIAIVTNRGPKILTVGGGEGGTTNALLLQRLIGPAGLKPVLTRPGVRHVRLPTAALHNLQAFNLATATFQPPDSTASPVPGSNPPELIETRASSSPWTDRDSQEVKPERGSSPEDTEPWNLPSSADPHDYSYEETVRTDNMDRTVLDAIPDRYSPDMEAQRIFDKMFDVDSKRSYIIDSQDDSRCAYDIDASDCDDKAYHQVVQRRDGSRHHRFAHVTHAATMRHKYAILEHELRLQGSIFSQKSLSEECEDLGVDSPSASELFPEAELLFGNSPAHDAQQHSHTPQPTVLSQCGIPQPDIDDQIATDQLLRHEGLDDQQDLGVTLGLDEGIVTVSEDGMQATIALDQEEFARSHPNTTFHSEPTEDGEIQPFIMAGLKGRHITSTVFHATRAPATVLVSAPPSASAAAATGPLTGCLAGASGPARPSHSEPHPSSHATQVIRRVCWDGRDGRFSVDAGEDAKTTAEDASRDEAPESPPGDDGTSSPERHAELFWESNSTSERSEGRRLPDFSSDSEKCCKSPSCDETNSTDSSGVGAHVRLDSVIKDARGIERSASADGSSADDTLPPVRTYPPKRTHRSHEGEAERSLTGKTRAGERALRRRASGRGVVKRGCHCCGGEPAPQRPKKARQRKPAADFASN